MANQIIDLQMQGDASLTRKLTMTMVRARIITTQFPAKWASALKMQVRKNARQFRRTGQYERTIVQRGGDVTSDHPAARRLERGFVGVDASGRTYHQAPRPHWRPAIDTIRRQMPKDAVKELGLGDP